MKRTRNRKVYALLLLAVIVIGGASRMDFTQAWPSLYTEYAGDTFWSLMIFLGIGFLFPQTHTLTLAALTLALSFGVEFSQLYEAKWIVELRATWIGKLTLGAGFLWSDFICYSLGCGIGALGEILWFQQKEGAKRGLFSRRSSSRLS